MAKLLAIAATALLVILLLELGLAYSSSEPHEPLRIKEIKEGNAAVDTCTGCKESTIHFHKRQSDRILRFRGRQLSPQEGKDLDKPRQPPTPPKAPSSGRP
ncbi:hypothetical protein PRUPE_3G091200 [Prunus persica]|uniref:Uncharacterized protein n=1 Tax=Prunus persica TaxID=3760 RepID=A0A251PXN1_PRUPE|nr:hypothetical protein PRUPE_3G091200 [Prunus persica]